MGDFRMQYLTKTIFCIAMVLLTIVSMWTTYVSLRDSILPEPVFNLDFGNGAVWPCSVFALALSVAIGLMLFALKLAIIDEHKRLNLFGILGLTIVGFISISFNLDVLYRTADKDFFLNYSQARMKGVYDTYLGEVQSSLVEKREEILKQVAKQEGELDAEVKGLRKKPAGYGTNAREEDYRLTVLEKTSAVELETVDALLAKKQEADVLLSSSNPASIDEIQQLQDQIRVIVKDVVSASGKPLPEVVKLENPLFAVFQKIFTLDQIGPKEVFFVVIAFFLDLGDIIGYSLVPSKKKRRKEDEDDGGPLLDLPEALRPDFALPSRNAEADAPLQLPNPNESGDAAATSDFEDGETEYRRPASFGR